MASPAWFRRPAIYLCRHGQTELNAQGYFRGWTDVPLDEEGIRSAEEMANYLAYEAIDSIAASDLQRAVQTAEIIGRDFDRNPMLRPWDIGEFAGKPKDSYQSKLQTFIDNPDKVVPHGESLSDFRRRWERTLDQYIAHSVTCEAPIVLITSTSNIMATKAMYEEGESDDPETIDIVEPGGIIALYLNGNGSVDFEPRLGAVISEGVKTS